MTRTSRGVCVETSIQPCDIVLTFIHKFCSHTWRLPVLGLVFVARIDIGVLTRGFVAMWERFIEDPDKLYLVGLIVVEYIDMKITKRPLLSLEFAITQYIFFCKRK